MSVKVDITATNDGLRKGFTSSRDIVRDSVADINRELGKVSSESAKHMGRAREEVSKFGAGAKGAGGASAELGGVNAALAGGFTKMLGPIAAVTAAITAVAAVAGAAVFVLKEVVAVQREFDKVNAGLITATGSAEKATEAFSALQDFATKTPYSLQEVSESFVKLVNLGLTPSERALTSYGNTASAMGKSLNQMIEAVADASTGEFERLKEFGIKASTEGDKITFRFRGVSETVRNEAGAIEEYLLKLGETNFGGAMEARMDTLDGAMSNLSDEWDKLILNLSASGLGEAIEDSVRLAIDLLAELNAYVASGQFEGHIEAMAAAWGPWFEDAREAIDIVRNDLAGFGAWLDDFSPGFAEALFAPWRDFPANVRAVIQLATVYVANGMQQMVTIVEANVATIKAIFTDDTIADARARGIAQVKANQTAFEDSIRAIVQERSETIAGTKAAIDGANARREAYERERAARAGDKGDKLAGYRQGGDGAATGEDKGAARARAQAAKEAEREAERARKEAFQAAMETLRQELDEWRNNYDERIRIARAMAEEVKKQYGENSAEFKKAQRTILELEREKAEQIRQIAEVEKSARMASAMAAIDAAEMEADRDYQIGLMSFQQRTAAQMQFEAERFAIQRQAFEERLAMMQLDPDMNPVEFARIKAELIEIEQQHQQRIGELRNRATVDAAGGTTNFFGTMESQFNNAMTGIITRQQSASQVMRSLWQSVYASFVQEMVVKPLIQYGIRVIKETALGKLLFGQQIAQQAAASAATIGTKSAETTAVVGMNAAQAGAGAAASQASIPFVGPVLALAAMAAVFAAVSALGGGSGGSKTTTTTTTLPSAANGFDIPSGINPVTQLHEREMVLPAEQADVIRDIAGGGNGGGGAVHLHVHAMDSGDVRRFLLQNKSAVADALKAAARDFKR